MRKFGRCAAIVLGLIAGGMANAAAQKRISGTMSNAAAARVIRLAELGNVRAQAQLAGMYAAGRNVPQDFFAAAMWYYRAADRGDGKAQLELGLLYSKGQGVPRDYVLAEMWLNLSAAHAIGDNRDYVARLRDAVSSKMTVQQLTVAQQLADAWYRSH